ncbi:hypothetical protein [Desulfosporosinus hippei]|uniref:Uncharacterized protein n=1 Tax=Desulfosporosinus hippei DSM 8344 TaxID=1121419 RepID=A0A1G7VG41_9FIRM|nr:hypothetical protein [Desulfosporosinus hippei]SDG58786.1 hypothetical protein SAMN05443529_104115 [Desulfosporosinus hippei DSM 8344]
MIWGYGIFDNEIASNIKDQFREFLSKGLSREEALCETVSIFKNYMEDELACLALASLQVRHNILVSLDNLEKALKLASGKGRLKWENEEGRKLVLEKFAKELKEFISMTGAENKKEVDCKTDEIKEDIDNLWEHTPQCRKRLLAGYIIREIARFTITGGTLKTLSEQLKLDDEGYTFLLRCGGLAVTNAIEDLLETKQIKLV